MLNQRRILSDNLLSPLFRHQISQRRRWTNSGHGYSSADRKNRFKNHRDNDDDDGKIQLFKSRGQHLLTCPRVLDAIVRASDIKSDDTVFEIGPGTGNLTLKLLEAAKNVVAVEIDERMVDTVQKRAAERGFLDRLKIIRGDALKVEFPQCNLIVANIPYNISSPLLTKLTYGVTKNPYRSATLLLQKEFARRLLAKPGDSEFNRFTVNMTLVAEVEFVMDVSRRDFVPCPKVDSSVVKLYPKSQVPNVDLDEWRAFTRTCFGKKNKTLGAMLKQKRKIVELMNLSKGEENDGDEETKIGLFKGKIVNVLESGRFSDKRASKMGNDELLHLLGLFNEAGVYFGDRSKLKDVNDAEYSDG